MSIKMTLRASTQLKNFLWPIFLLSFFGSSLKNLRNIEFWAEKWPWVFLGAEFFWPWVFWKRSNKKPALMQMHGLFQWQYWSWLLSKKRWNNPVMWRSGTKPGTPTSQTSTKCWREIEKRPEANNQSSRRNNIMWILPIWTRDIY